MSRRLFAVMALVVLLGACGGGDDNGSKASGPDGSDGAETSTSVGSDPGGGTSTSQPGLTGISTPGGGTAPPGTPKPPKPPHAPAVGRYLYAGGDQGQNEVAFDVHDDQEGTTEYRQLHTWTDDDSIARSQVVWRPDGRYAEIEQRARPGEVGHSCQWSPVFLEQRLPAQVGASWTSESGCARGTETGYRRRIEARITGTDRVDVAGTQVDVVVIERTLVETTVLGEERIEEKRVSTDRYAASLGLLVRSEGTLTRTFRGKTSSTPTRIAVKSLTPTPHPAS